MNNAQIKHMVDRFLSWHLPEHSGTVYRRGGNGCRVQYRAALAPEGVTHMPGSYSPFARRAYALPPARGYKPPTPSKGVGVPSNALMLNGKPLTLNGKFLTLGA